MKKRKALAINTMLLILAFTAVTAGSQGLFAQNVVTNSDTTRTKTTITGIHIQNPVAWISDCYNRLNHLYLTETERKLDTFHLMSDVRTYANTITLLEKDFYAEMASLNIRSIYNLKMRVADILSDIDNWQYKIHGVNEDLTDKTREVLMIREEIAEFNEQADSLFQTTFREAILNLSARQKTGEESLLRTLKAATIIENRIVDLKIRAYTFHTDINSLLTSREASLLKTELPPVWKSSPDVYRMGFFRVVKESFFQTLESIKYYGEMALWRILIFRVIVFIMCMIPIKIFNDELRKNRILGSVNLTFLHKYPKTATLIMGLAFAPFIFVHPPHAFLEMFLIGLTFTVTLLTLKIYPKISKHLLGTLILAFVILYLINFFVTPTFLGRLIYSLSLLLLIPLILLYRQLPTYDLVHEKIVRILLVFFALHLVTGWVFVILGNYTLGRSVILAGYSLIILAMIFRITIHTLIDYLTIVAYFLNRRLTTMKINLEYLARRIKPLLIVLTVGFLLVSYLFNMNVYDIVKGAVLEFLVSTRSIGSTEYSIFSILLFFLSVWLAFALASTIRYLFEPQYQETVRKRSRFGGYLLGIRLLIICTGIVAGILISGLPMTNFSIFLGALGVGIGLGLQNIVSNLVSGIIIAFERPFVVGDVLDFGADTGTVKEISLRATMVTSSEGADILIPNNSLLSQNLKNWTISGKQRFIQVKVNTLQDCNPDDVIRILVECIDRQPGIIRDKSVVYFSDITEKGFEFLVKVLITDLSKAQAIKTDILLSIQKKSAEAGIRFFEMQRTES